MEVSEAYQRGRIKRGCSQNQICKLVAKPAPDIFRIQGVAFWYDPVWYDPVCVPLKVVSEPEILFHRADFEVLMFDYSSSFYILCFKANIIICSFYVVFFIILCLWFIHYFQFIFVYVYCSKHTFSCVVYVCFWISTLKRKSAIFCKLVSRPHCMYGWSRV